MHLGNSAVQELLKGVLGGGGAQGDPLAPHLGGMRRQDRVKGLRGVRARECQGWTLARWALERLARISTPCLLPSLVRLKCDCAGVYTGEPYRGSCGCGDAGGESFHQQNVRAKKDADPLGCLGDLGWYCVRAALFAFDYKPPVLVQAHPGPHIALISQLPSRVFLFRCVVPA